MKRLQGGFSKLLGKKKCGSVSEAYRNKEMKTLLPSNCHQVEKRQTCSEKQNEISYGVRLQTKTKTKKN